MESNRAAWKTFGNHVNPDSQYFHERTEDKDSYFRKVIHTNVEEIKDYISKPYCIMKEEYFLVIKGEEVFETSDKNMQVCISWWGKNNQISTIGRYSVKKQWDF